MPDIEQSFLVNQLAQTDAKLDTLLALIGESPNFETLQRRLQSATVSLESLRTVIPNNGYIIRYSTTTLSTDREIECILRDNEGAAQAFDSEEAAWIRVKQLEPIAIGCRDFKVEAVTA